MIKYVSVGLVFWAVLMLIGMAIRQPILFLAACCMHMFCTIIGLAVQDIKNATR